MCKVVGVRYREGCKIYDFDAGEFELSKGETVIVDSEQGVGAATVATEVYDRERGPDERALKKVIRRATEDDMARLEKNRAVEQEAFRVCQAKIKEREMIMKLVRVEWAFDNSKSTFYFTADGRVDFRDLVKDLAHRFRIRIEMRQIGVRDEAKMIGGYGPCGRHLCCSSFLRDFEPVSIKMAKKQDLVLNPAKISGICGRLMCCLGYEYSFYDEARREARKKEKEKETVATADVAFTEKYAETVIENSAPRPAGRPQGGGRPQQQRQPGRGGPERQPGRPQERVPGKVIEPGGEGAGPELTEAEKQEKQKKKRNAWRKRRKKPKEAVGEPGGEKKPEN